MSVEESSHEHCETSAESSPPPRTAETGWAAFDAWAARRTRTLAWIGGVPLTLLLTCAPIVLLLVASLVDDTTMFGGPQTPHPAAAAAVAGTYLALLLTPCVAIVTIVTSRRRLPRRTAAVALLVETLCGVACALLLAFYVSWSHVSS